MNGKKIIAATMLGMMAFGGAINVSATESTVGPASSPQPPTEIKKESLVKVNIQESDHLELVKVLDTMNFKMEYSKKDHLVGNIRGELGKVKVESGNTRSWKVTAKLKNDQLTSHKNAYKVDYFQIQADRGHFNLVNATGANKVILQGDKFGTTQKTFKGATIAIRNNNTLLPKAELKGTINYTLARVKSN
ncbi:hypothetical protein [Candidatus Enterococcus leclercqii]|uniref:hypothetical protein n=1 Tax=Candidatus Enterococcus leclercqii TaxID=1857218 RepID=UPI00137B5217|nr:hypothetical protein [Enterococcus sp. CU9D]KAF1293714.1 hypothetical protein BAU14_13950 [Enterococcus sp. CU9D]